MAGLAYSAIGGGLPSDPRSSAFVEWVVQDYMAHRLRELLNPSTRSRTIHIDPATGDDLNDGSAGNPIETLSRLHDLLVAEAGSVEVVFAAGAVFRERGKDIQWLASDGGHNAAVYVNRDSVTFRNADDGDPPEFWCGNNRIAASAGWTLEGVVAGVYEIDVSGQPDVADGIGWVVDEGDVTQAYTRAASVAAMSGVDRCFFFDGATDTLYVRVTGASPASQAWFLIPSNDLSGIRIEADDVVVNLPGALWVGWGLDEADTNSHDYAVSVGATGAEEVLVRPGTGYYGSSHIFATWHPGTSAETGGIVTFVGCRGGLNQPGSGERLVNFFQPGGEQECLAIDCLADQAIAGGSALQSVNGHTSLSTVVNFFIAWDCGETNMNNLPVPATEADFRGFTFFTKVADSAPADELFCVSPNMSVVIPSSGFATSANYGATMINGNMSINGSATGLSRAGWINSATAANSDGRFDHCLFNITTKTGGADIGTGIDFDVMSTDGVKTSIIARACVFQRASGSTGNAGIGIADEAAQQIDNGYFEIGTGTLRNEAGYAVSAANPLTMTTRVVMGTAVDAELDEHATRRAEYDYYLRPRAASDAPGPIASGALATASPDAGLAALLSIGDGILDAMLNSILVEGEGVSSIAVNAIGNTLSLTTVGSATVGAGGGGGLTLTASGGAVVATYDSVGGSTVSYTLDREITDDETVTASYTQPGNGLLSGGENVTSFTDMAVTNNSTVPSGGDARLPASFQSVRHNRGRASERLRA